MGRSVRELPIDERVKNFLISVNVRELYPPQEEAVDAGLFDGKNILMSTSTNSGKTTLANALMLDTVLTKHVKAVYLSPTRALARERADWLSKKGAVKNMGVKVAVATRDYDKVEEGLKDADIIIATYEKFDSLIRHNVPWLSSIGLVVLDEVHLIGEEERGPVVESIVAGLRHRGVRPQFLALSATIGNTGELANYLGAQPIISKWRPTPLIEGVYYDGVIHYKDGTEAVVEYEKEPVANLVLDTILNDKDAQVLVFATSRFSAVNYANMLAGIFESYDIKPRNDVGKFIRELKEKAQEYAGLANRMEWLIKRGVAYHHAGLGAGIRRAIEDAFKDGAIRVVVSTTTLAVGVNLPARRVVIPNPRIRDANGKTRLLSVIEYKQMAGRAGRYGLDPYGEAILVAEKKDEVDVFMRRYVFGSPEPVVSKLVRVNDYGKDYSALEDFVLAQFASGAASSPGDAKSILTHTFAYHQRLAKESDIDDIINTLVKAGFLMWVNGVLVPTEFGVKTSMSYISVRTALLFKRGIEIVGAKKPGELGLLFHLAMAREARPLLPIDDKEREEYMSRYEESRHRLIIAPTPSDDVLSAFKTALLLNDWINEVPRNELSEDYGVGPGDFEGLIDTFSWLAASLARIAKLLGAPWYGEAYALSYRIKYGVKPELLELAKAYIGTGIGRERIRKLYNAGYRTLEDIARASPKEIEDNVPGFGPTLARKAVEIARKKLGWDRAPNQTSITDYL